VLIVSQRETLKKCTYYFAYWKTYAKIVEAPQNSDLFLAKIAAKLYLMH